MMARSLTIGRVTVATIAMVVAAGLVVAEPAATSIEQLRGQLEGVLKATHTPGLSVAIVRRDGSEWTAGLGWADVASRRPATAGTLFRIGSTSKAFASMAVLQLVEQGRLTLDARLHDVAPEVWFENPWEATDPVRVVNLLEHTTGWDDIHMCVYAQTAASIGLREALDYDRHSRRSRWRPGTRSAYNNSGPAVAAYVVEKVSGQRFEDYVQTSLFGPIGMSTATYFQPASSASATLYHAGGDVPYPYWHLSLRPAGAINASANDMAAYLAFVLGRGAVRGRQVLSARSVDRMEAPATGWPAREGVACGYGLSNVCQLHEGFVYHGHGGALSGGLTDFAYMPDHGVGYFYSINSDSLEAYKQVGDLIRAYLERRLTRPSVAPAGSLPNDARAYDGWYEPASPRNELGHGVERLVNLIRVRFDATGFRLTYMNGETETFVPVAGGQFRKVKDGEADPVPTVVLIPPNAEGRFINFGIGRTFRQVPGWYAMGQLTGVALVLLSILSILLYAPFWTLAGLAKHRRRPAERAMRIGPLIAAGALLTSIVVLARASGGDATVRLGTVTPWSIALFLLTAGFGTAAFASAVASWRAPREGVRRSVRAYSIVVALALVLAALYCAYWGLIPIRTWA
jgi:CubicO group peptidase (beta-lactamase class C family)